MRSFALLALAACTPDFEAAEAAAEEQAIINGVAATEAWTSSAVALMYLDGTRLEGPYCTGVLISPELVLTAAHCADFLSAGEVAVHVGAYPTTRVGNRTYTVSDIEVHPGWNPNTLENDVAALYLSRSVTQRITYFPTLPGSLGFGRADVGVDAAAVGFGATEFSDGGTRERALIEVVDITSFPGVVFTDGSTSSVCFGDSGGPLFYLRNGQGYVAGIHSFVGDDRCSSYSGHTRLDQQGSFLSGL